MRGTTPLVRKLAADLGVNLGAITGTGVAGRIRAQDVYNAADTAEEALYRSLFGDDTDPAPAALGPQTSESDDEFYLRIFPKGQS